MSTDTIKIPSLDQLREVADELGFSMPDSELAVHLETLVPGFGAYNLIDRMPDEHAGGGLPPHAWAAGPDAGGKPVSAPGMSRPPSEGAATGKLKGKTVAHQGQYLSGRRADDQRRPHAWKATSRTSTPRSCTRILDAGGTIAGKTRVRAFLLLRRQPHQFHRPRPQPAPPRLLRRRLLVRQRGSWSRPARCRWRWAGDQGGSIRIPASYCGIYGLKPTHGLVPYTGIMPIET